MLINYCWALYNTSDLALSSIFIKKFYFFFIFPGFLVLNLNLFVDLNVDCLDEFSDLIYKYISIIIFYQIKESKHEIT